MLSACEIERITALWTPDEWPPFADSYAKACNRTPFPYYVERVRHLGIGGEFVIDAGCGSGRWSFPLATAFDRVLGFDYTLGRLRTADWLGERLNVPSVRFTEGDIRRIPAEDASADAVYSNSVAVGRIPISLILEQCFRVLKPGGVCYLGLNGIGYAYGLAARDDPKLADLGRKRIYNTLCQRHFSALVNSLAPSGAKNGPARAALAMGAAPATLFTDLDFGADVITAARTIAEDLPAEFTESLRNELTAITKGRRGGFSHEEAGRDFEPEEMRAAAHLAGFDRFEWALDGCLSLGADGEISKGPSTKAKPGPGEFEGRLRVFEMLMWKPKPEAA